MEESPAPADTGSEDLSVDLDVEVVAGTLHLAGPPEQLAALGPATEAVLLKGSAALPPAEPSAAAAGGGFRSTAWSHCFSEGTSCSGQGLG